MKSRLFLRGMSAAVLVGVLASSASAADERWLSHIVLDELARCQSQEQFEALGKRLEAAVLSRLSCGRLEEMTVLTDMLYAIRACRYLPVIADSDEGKKLAGWILAHPSVARLLMRALNDVRSPKDALERFGKLQAAEEQRVLDYGDLAAAFATSSPARHYRQPPKSADIVDCFRYYTDPKGSFRYSLKKMPYELSRHLADSRTDIEERKWAASKYSRARDPSAAFFHVKYDYDYYKSGQPKKISTVDYTLENLARVGGVCIDQAYYACEVCKAIGIPATITYGRGGAGIGHAWLSFFQLSPNGKDASWNASTGRYASQGYYIGTVRDPASGEMVLDSDLRLSGSAALLPAGRREEADTACALAALADRLREQAANADVGPLNELAELFRQRFGPKAAGEAPASRPAPAAPKADKAECPPLVTGWIKKSREVDSSVVEDLIALAIKRNLAHKEAWDLVVELRKADRIPANHLDRFFDVLIQKTSAIYPEYSCLMVLKIVPTLPKADLRETAYKRTLKVYGTRPDLRGRITIALGEELVEAGDTKKALKAFQTAAIEGVQLAEVVLKAAGRAEDILVEAKQTSQAIRMYQQLFARTQKSSASDEVRKSTSNYQLGQRLAGLLKAAGKTAAAEEILSRI